MQNKWAISPDGKAWMGEYVNKAAAVAAAINSSCGWIAEIFCHYQSERLPLPGEPTGRIPELTVVRPKRVFDLYCSGGRFKNIRPTMIGTVVHCYPHLDGVSDAVEMEMQNDTFTIHESELEVLSLPRKDEGQRSVDPLVDESIRDELLGL